MAGGASPLERLIQASHSFNFYRELRTHILEGDEIQSSRVPVYVAKIAREADVKWM